MSSSLSSIADNLAEGPQRSKCKDCKSDLEYLILKYNTAIFECADCNKIYKKRFDEGLSKRFRNTYKFYDGDLSKFCLML